MKGSHYVDNTHGRGCPWKEKSTARQMLVGRVDTKETLRDDESREDERRVVFREDE